MNQIIEIWIPVTLAIFLVTGFTVWLYWAVIYPAFIQALKFRVRSLRDEMKLKAMSGEINSDAKEFSDLFFFFRIAEFVLESPLNLIYEPVRKNNRTHYEVVQKAKAMQNASLEIREAFDSLGLVMMGWTVAVRPLYLLLLPFVIISALFSSRALNRWKNWKNDNFDRGARRAFA